MRKFTQVLSHELQQAADILLGKLAPGRAWHPPAKVDVRAIRAKTGPSQTHFARRFGFSTGVVREWGARPPPAGGGMTFRSASGGVGQKSVVLPADAARLLGLSRQALAEREANDPAHADRYSIRCHSRLREWNFLRTVDDNRDAAGARG